MERALKYIPNITLKKKIKNIVIDTEDTSAMAAHGVLP